MDGHRWYFHSRIAASSTPRALPTGAEHSSPVAAQECRTEAYERSTPYADEIVAAMRQRLRLAREAGGQCDTLRRFDCHRALQVVEYPRSPKELRVRCKFLQLLFDTQPYLE